MWTLNMASCWLDFYCNDSNTGSRFEYENSDVLLALVSNLFINKQNNIDLDNNLVISCAILFMNSHVHYTESVRRTIQLYS